MAGIIGNEFEAIKKDQPELYAGLQKLIVSFNDLAMKAAAAAVSGAKPGGPRNVAVANLGAEISVTWDDDKSGVSIGGYRILRASAGTRLSPTTPTFASAVQVKVLPGNGKTCPALGANSWADSNFSIANFNPQDPARFTYWVQSISEGLAFSEPVQATSSPIELKNTGKGEATPNPLLPALNRFSNAAFRNALVTVANRALPKVKLVSAATNAAPIEITTTTNHGMLTNDHCCIADVTGNIAANGVWIITKVSNTKFTLNGSTGTGAWVSGGTVIPLDGQPDPPSESAQLTNNPLMTGWVDASDVGNTSTAQFVASGSASVQNNEVLLQAPSGTALSTVCAQPVDGTMFAPGEIVTATIWARLGPGDTAPSNSTLNIFLITGSSSVIKAFSGSTWTTSGQRFSFVFKIPETIPGTSTFFTLRFENDRITGTGRDLYISRPMFNKGSVPSIWTEMTDTSMGVGTYSTNVDVAVPPFGRDTYGYIAYDSSVSYA